MNNLSDQAQRERALDPTNSFIVQAPAGSGKTELLTQRFLRLLSNVTFPEEILAITFTKKSASEMRDRIMSALDDAANAKPIESSHKKSTRDLALQALKQNEAHNWNLLQNPNRLRIQTIDSFNAWLASRLPTLSCFGASPEVADEPILLYREAAQEFLSHLDENTDWSDAIEKLLIHLDNDMDKVEDLLIKMLQQRDQWLPYIALTIDNTRLRKKLELNLKSVITDILYSLDQSFPKEQAKELISLVKIATQNVLLINPNSPLSACKELEHFPGTSLQDLSIWLGLSKLLFTDQLQWRKRFDKNIGFPASSQATHPDEKVYLKEIQERMKNLIEKLSAHSNLRDAFIALNQAPTSTYQNNQWEILASLHQSLKVVTAQLKLIFQRYGKIDYIENAHAAIHSLGTDEQPTDLALALDYKLKHILVDEFQDTSNSQYRLIEKLISGWEHNDGRTLFLVGDPMQSIYRFREAEVGLFIQARQHGIKQLPLIPLSLSVNFRSTPNIVDWVNLHFKKIMPPQDNIEQGAISFCASSANKSTLDHSGVTLHPFIAAEHEAQAEQMLAIIKSSKEQFPEDKIAILVRSRSHLKYIIPLLKHNHIAFQALDIDPLTTRPVIQDLLALTKALLHPAHRVDWLSVLRAPYCGFLLSDLLVLSSHSTNETIWQRMQDPTCKLSQDGQKRLARILPIFKLQLAERRRFPLHHWVEKTWQLLGGPACVQQFSDLDDASTFFKLLEKLDVGGDLIYFNDLDNAIEKLYASPTVETNATLQIMTIHNAKGLEFDTVILPHLESRTPYDDPSLLLWMERAVQNQRQLIMAPIQASGDESDAIYEYVKTQQKIKSDFESSRLLYVAATRAKKQLHLLFSLEKSENTEKLKPPAHSLLEKLWPAIEETVLDQFKNKPLPASGNSTQNHNQKLFRRLPSRWKNSYKQSEPVVTLHQQSPGFYLDANDSKYIGTLIHKVLENIALRGSVWWQSLKHKNYILHQLLQLGMLKGPASSSVDTVLKAIENTLADPRGQWILAAHKETKVEWALTVQIKGMPKQCVIDRTFIDETGTRWIIDYKSTNCPDISLLDSFLAEEYKKHEPQLQDYLLAVKAMNNNANPVKLGLYYPLIPAWYEVMP